MFNDVQFEKYLQGSFFIVRLRGVRVYDVLWLNVRLDCNALALERLGIAYWHTTRKKAISTFNERI
jgi:hypothetical protein